jgi:nanoRNase/pAp phosphatase (c-di-AMP/oligoRNAs hydrolase)
MALTPEQQTIELITRAKRILVITRDQAPTDAIASVISCTQFLGKLEKGVEGVIPNLKPETQPKFLAKGLEGILPATGPMRHFELTLDLEKTDLGELFYDVHDKQAIITIVPKAGEWTPKDVHFRAGQDRYDLIIALDCPDMASLGPLFREHADFIYRTPTINIDHDPGNEHWGQVNLVDLTAVATTEILFRLFETWNHGSIDADLATNLLTGMIAKTQSFRTMNVTPRTLQAVSQLIAYGGRREEIVHGLWRTKTVPTLKLWGRALTRLEQDHTRGIIWTYLVRQDFLESGTSSAALEGIVRELISYSPEARVIVLIYEDEDASSKGACVIIHTVPPFSAQELGRTFGASGGRDRVSFNQQAADR